MHQILITLCKAGGSLLRPSPHILQIIEAKEAGAAGILGVIASVSSAGAPVLSSFTAAIGLDAPVEVSAGVLAWMLYERSKHLQDAPSLHSLRLHAYGALVHRQRAVWHA